MKLPVLRRKARALGVEKVFLKTGGMTLFFVSDKSSAFYRSATFSRVIDYAMQHPRSCRLDESGGRRRMSVAGIASPQAAIDALNAIAPPGSRAS
jgi:transcription-repair coupling factor (superfamily II helicase)